MVTDDYRCVAAEDRKGNKKAKGTGKGTKYHNEPSGVAQPGPSKKIRK